MLEHDLPQTGVLRGFGRFQQRRVAFAQRDDVLQLSVEGKQFAIAPNAALVNLGVRHAALTPCAFQICRCGQFARVVDLE